MHRCLLISEILRIVLENVSSLQPAADLLAIALVSKNFCELALDELWTFQSSLTLLIKTLPPDLWTEDGVSRKLVGFIHVQPNF